MRLSYFGGVVALHGGSPALDGAAALCFVGHLSWVPKVVRFLLDGFGVCVCSPSHRDDSSRTILQIGTSRHLRTKYFVTSSS